MTGSGIKPSNLTSRSTMLTIRPSPSFFNWSKDFTFISMFCATDGMIIIFFHHPMPQPGFELGSVQLQLLEGPFAGRFTDWASAATSPALNIKIVIYFYFFADVSSSSTMPRLEPFASGQIYNVSRNSRVQVLPGTSSASISTSTAVNIRSNASPMSHLHLVIMP